MHAYSFPKSGRIAAAAGGRAGRTVHQAADSAIVHGMILRFPVAA
jgi:hypothetical protein